MGLLAALAVFAVYLTLTAWLLWRRSVAGLLGLSFLPLFCFAFKSGVVRQDGRHLAYFFMTVATLLAVLMLAAENKLEVTAMGWPGWWFFSRL
jgi:hypothetical protein